MRQAQRLSLIFFDVPWWPLRDRSWTYLDSRIVLEELWYINENIKKALMTQLDLLYNCMLVSWLRARHIDTSQSWMRFTLLCLLEAMRPPVDVSRDRFQRAVACQFGLIFGWPINRVLLQGKKTISPAKDREPTPVWRLIGTNSILDASDVSLHLMCFNSEHRRCQSWGHGKWNECLCLLSGVSAARLLKTGSFLSLSTRKRTSGDSLLLWHTLTDPVLSSTSL